MRMRGIIVALLALLISVASTAFVAAQGRGPGGAQYDRGYEDGYRDGQRDARQGRRYDFDNDARFRRGSNEFRSGYSEGYRSGYDRDRVRGAARNARPGVFGGRGGRGGYQDPAFARGYSDGYERGLDDGRGRDRYDPVRHRDYRNGDEGYFRDYGPRRAYENNYRAGFRQGYEQGYREGGRSRGGWWPF